MIKIFLLLEGREAPFALTEQAAAEEVRGLLPDIAGYVQTRAMGDAPFSGCAEFYFGNESGAGSLDPATLSSLFSGATRVAASVSGDHRVVMRLPQFFKGPNVKGVYPFRRRVDLAVADFQAYWWHTHGPIAALTEHALAYCQTHPMQSAYEHGEPDFDGVTEIFWPDMQSAESAVASRQMTEDQAGDAQNFVDLDSVMLFFGVEDVVIEP